MRVHFTIGVANGDQDRDLLDQYRSGGQAASAAAADPARRPAGWPAPSDRCEDDSEPRHPAWAW